MKTCLRKLFYFYLLIHLNFTALAQIDSKKDQLFFNNLYNFQFAEADSLISTIDSAEQSLHFNFLKAHYMRWYYLPIHQQSETILSLYNQYLEATGDEDFDADLNYFSVNSALLKAEFNYNQGNYYRAFQNGAKIYDVVKNHLESKPDRTELKFLASLYHYYYQYYKSENPVFGTMMWFFQEGDKATGLNWLKEVAEDNTVLRTEALVYLTHIYLRLENQPKSALDFATQLIKRHPNNLKFYELFIEAHLNAGQLTEEVYSQIEYLIAAEKVYFQKYGITYKALYISRLDTISSEAKLKKIEEAKTFIMTGGKADHLMSLLLFQQNLIKPDEFVFEQAQEIMVYNYQLTKIK